MADILTLAQARSALGWQPASHASDEAELSEFYIPAVTEVIAARATVPDPVPATVLLVARRVLARTWNADHQGTGTGRPESAAAVVAELTEEDLLLLWPILTLGGFA